MADDAAFESFVRGNSAGLVGTAVLLTGSRDAAEELVQDTLTLLYPRWERVAAADEPLAYVRRSLMNRFISQRRMPGARDLALWELPDGWDGRDLGEAVAVRRTVWQLLGTLSERQRAAIVLRHFHDLPETEIATMLQCRPASVRSLISRGMASMRTTYIASDSTARTGTTS
jgi:RNA polymerase sigma-70 factor (sigma-E family)